MNVIRLKELLKSITITVSNGALTDTYLGALGVPTVLVGGLLKPEDLAASAVDIVDCYLVSVAVRTSAVVKVRQELIEVLNDDEEEVLVDGPSYKQLVPLLGEPLAVLQLFAAGHSLGLWQIVTPNDLNIEPEARDAAALLGMVNITGYPLSVFDFEHAVAEG